MNKIVSFKKEIAFTNLFEITSISLEHNYEIKNHNVIGNFIVSGEYRNFSTSLNTVEFNKSVPFTIDILDKYDISNLKIDIDDFNYEIEDNKQLIVNIDIVLDNLEEINDCVEKEDKRDLIDDINTNLIKEIQDNNDTINNIDIEGNTIDIDNIVNNISYEDKNDTSIFANINNEETYKTYKIYIVKENDNLDTIIDKYNTSKEKLQLYNDISQIKQNDKIIIPND